MERRFQLVNFLLGILLGAVIAVAGTRVDDVDARNDERRFTLDFFQRWDTIMVEAESPEQRLEWLKRLDLAHRQPAARVIERSIELTRNEIAERRELVRNEKLRMEAEAAAAVAAVAQEADEKTRAQRVARQKLAQANAAESLAAEKRRQVRLLNLELGFPVDRRQRRTAVP